MKRVLALLLAFLCCICLASCNFLPKTEVRTTITKDEWNAALTVGNYSVVSNYMLPLINSGNHFSSGGGEVIKMTKDCFSIDFYSKSETTFDSLYCKIIDGVLYDIKKTNEGYIASKKDIEDVDNNTPIENLGNLFLSAFNLDWNAVYDSLVYIEDCKTYRGVLGSIEDGRTVSVQIEMECENGKIKKLRLYLADRDIHEPLNGLFTFYDFGTTVVEIPEYTFANE